MLNYTDIHTISGTSQVFKLQLHCNNKVTYILDYRISINIYPLVIFLFSQQVTSENPVFQKIHWKFLFLKI